MVRIQVEYDKNQMDALRQGFISAEQKARYKALYFTGQTIRRYAWDEMNSWPKMTHPLSTLWRNTRRFSQGGPGSPFWSQGEKPQPRRPFGAIKPLLRFDLSPSWMELNTGWGTKSKRKVRALDLRTDRIVYRSGKERGEFGGYAEEIGNAVERGASYRVTDRMRKAIAARTQGDVTLKSGTVLRVPARPVWAPVSERLNVSATFGMYFEKYFQIGWDKWESEKQLPA